MLAFSSQMSLITFICFFKNYKDDVEFFYIRILVCQWNCDNVERNGWLTDAKLRDYRSKFLFFFKSLKYYTLIVCLPHNEFFVTSDDFLELWNQLCRISGLSTIFAFSETSVLLYNLLLTIDSDRSFLISYESSEVF